MVARFSERSSFKHLLLLIRSFIIYKMSSFINLLPDGCVDFEKWGDVVVSVKDNLIGVYCHFCNDIFTSLLEFLHHLQWVHKDVLAFTKEHNVYTMDELMSLPDIMPVEPKDAVPNSCSSDSRVASNAPFAVSGNHVDVLSGNIKNALAAYGVELDEFEEEILKENDSSNTLMKRQAEDPKLSCTATDFKPYQELKLQSTERQNVNLSNGRLKHIKGTQHDIDSIITKSSTNATNCRKNLPKNQHQAANLKLTGRIQEAESKIKSIKKIQPLCNLKSYAIARSARKRQQQQRLGSIKKRIFRCLENDEINLNCQSLNEKHLHKYQKNMTKPIVEIEAGHKINPIQFQGQNNVIENTAEVFKDSVDSALNYDSIDSSKSNIKSEKMTDCSSSINVTQKTLNPIIIQKIEYLPKINLKLENRNLSKMCSPEYTPINQPTENPENEIQKRQRSSSLSVISSPAVVNKRPTRRPSYSSSAPNSGEVQMQTIKPVLNNISKQNIKRKHAPSSASMELVEAKQTKVEVTIRDSLHFNFSESAVEILQTDLKSSLIDADSILQLADPQLEINSVNKVIRQGDTPQNKFPKAETADPTYSMNPTKIRDDLELLLSVGLPIIKDPNMEDRKPVEYCESLRLKANNFSKILKTHDIIWNSKRISTQCSQKIEEELAILTKEINNDLMAKLNISELKRIWNLINAWYVEQMNQKFFKKVQLSTAMEYYLLLFGFLPKINRSLYYCEWCEESSASKSRYEKHRSIHYGNFLCRHCKRGFTKMGNLMTHVRIRHGKEN